MADPEFVLLGDAIWLEFVNTAATPPEERDLLPDRAAYHRWTKAVKLASERGNASFDQLLQLRARLVNLAGALAEGRSAPAPVVQLVNRILRSAEGHEQLTRVSGAWRLQFQSGRHPSAVEAIAASVAATLADGAAKVRRCGGTDCTLYFIDRGTVPARRWCSFARCGQRLRLERRRGSRITPVV